MHENFFDATNKITPADAKGPDWQAERWTVRVKNPISPIHDTYSDVMLPPARTLWRTAPPKPCALLRSLDHYNKGCLEWLAEMIRITPMPDPQRRAMLFGAVKMAHAFLWAEAPHDD